MISAPQSGLVLAFQRLEILLGLSNVSVIHRMAAVMLQIWDMVVKYEAVRMELASECSHCRNMHLGYAVSSHFVVNV